MTTDSIIITHGRIKKIIINHRLYVLRDVSVCLSCVEHTRKREIFDSEIIKVSIWDDGFRFQKKGRHMHLMTTWFVKQSVDFCYFSRYFYLYIYIYKYTVILRTFVVFLHPSSTLILLLNILHTAISTVGIYFAFETTTRPHTTTRFNKECKKFIVTVWEFNRFSRTIFTIH